MLFMTTNENLTNEIKPSSPRLKAVALFIFELVKIGVLAALTIGLIRYFLFKPFYVKGASMEPTFFDHEYLIVDELSYYLRLPQRGEVVVFKYPENPTEYFLKRVIGLPGERVKVSAGVITVYNKEHPEGVLMIEPYLPTDLITAGENTYTVGPDQYFVLGDNRSNSFDSRRFGPINKSFIVGRAWFRGWPIDRMQMFSTPSFNI
jgi:signal peptidase I